MSRHGRLRLWLLVVGFPLAACGGSGTTNLVGPTSAKCQVSVANNTAELPASGGNGSLTVTAARECSWSVQPQNAWISVASRSGQGDGTVPYTVQANPNGTSRRGEVLVSNQSVDVVQAAAPCHYDASPSAIDSGAQQTDAVIALTATPGCQWTARSDVPWILAMSPADGTGNATIHLTIAANTAEARAGNITLGDARVAVHQSAAAPTPEPPSPTPEPPPTPTCTFGIAPADVSIGADAADVHVMVTAPDGCAWTAAADVPWLSITAGASGTGNGDVAIAVSANTGQARTATLTIAGHAVTITQAAAAPPPPPQCDYALNPQSYDAGPGADAVSVAVSAGATCTWTATTSASWIAIDAAGGTGNGTVHLTIQANTGDSRSGVVTIGGKPFTVRQAAACTYSINPTSFNAGSDAATTSVAVTAGATCGWTAATDASWITIDPQTGSGTGPGVVRLAIAQNTGDARTGTVVIGGQAFTVQQAGACTYTLSPDGYDAAAGTDAVTVSVTTGPTCGWTSTTDADWITIDPQTANGTGNGSVRIAIQANTGDARTGTVMIGGQAFMVRQQAASCTYAIKPSYYNSGRGPDTVTVDVTTSPSCAWTAESPVPWATVTAGATGTGNGTVTIAVEANDGPPRLATLTIAGQPFRLSQEGMD